MGKQLSLVEPNVLSDFIVLTLSIMKNLNKIGLDSQFCIMKIPADKEMQC